MIPLEKLFHFDVPWGVNRFPDGQIQLWFETDKDTIKGECALINAECTQLVSQLSSFVKRIELDVHYLYGARSDKSVQGNRIVANVADVILYDLSLLDKVNVLDPHCDQKEDFRVCHWLNATKHRHSKIDLREYAAIIFADESAERRFMGKGVQVYHFPTIVCEKERDQETGHIINYKVPGVPKGKCLVVDDICDGGATFLLLGEAVGNELDLCVTHGIFSNNADTRLLQRYGKIFTTNSYPQDCRVLEGNVIIDNVWTIPGR